MQELHADLSIQHVYARDGRCSDRSVDGTEAEPVPPRVPSIADQISVTEIMTRELTCARRDLDVRQLVSLVVRQRIGCVPVVEEVGRPVGIITKLDLVEQLLAPERALDDELAPILAGELMMPFALTLGASASIAHAAAMMAIEDIHHIAIVDDDGRLIGIVSSMDVVRWLARNDGFAV